jgi:acyl-CoA dehydrogenase
MKSNIYEGILSECDRFIRKEVLPCALEADLSADKNTARRLWDKSGGLDLPALLVPEDLGGAGMNLLAGALVLDRLASACAGFASVFACHFAACAAAASAGAKSWFSYLSGQDGRQSLITSVCLPSTREEKPLSCISEKDHLVVSGTSSFTGNDGLAGAVMVFAGKNGNPDDTVAVRIDPTAAGVGREEPLRLPGLKMNAFTRLVFDRVRVEADAVLATGEEAGKMQRSVETAFYGFVAAMAMGCARSAFQKAKDYAGQRYQFKQTIILHQEIQRLLGSMRMKLNTGTAACLDLLDVEKWRPVFHDPEAPLVKAFCTDAALEIVIDAIQIHGGYGYMHEYGLEKAMRDIKVLQVLGETNPYLLVHHISDKL